MKCSPGISNFLEKFSVFPILLFSSISLHWSLRKAFLSLLVILWNSAFRWLYLYVSPLPFASLLSSAICKISSDNLFAFICGRDDSDHHLLYKSWTSVHRSSGTLSDLILWICLADLGSCNCYSTLLALGSVFIWTSIILLPQPKIPPFYYTFCTLAIDFSYCSQSLLP